MSCKGQNHHGRPQEATTRVPLAILRHQKARFGVEVNVRGGGGGLGETMDLKATGVWYIRSAHGETP